MSEVTPAPTVSVIVPVYNVEPYLSDCVRSLMRQDFDSLEIILVDDGSTDSSGRMADDYAEKYPFVKVIHKTNAGLGMARNSGLEIAKGEWVVFLDSDDMLVDGAIKEIMKIAESRPDIDEVRFTSRRFNASERPPTSMPDTEASPIFSPADSISKVHPILKALVPQWRGARFDAPATQNVCSLYRRSVITSAALLFPSERELISEDIVFNIDFAAACRTIAYSPLPLQLYRITPGSLSTALRPDRVDKSAIFCDFIEGQLARLGEPDAAAVAMGAMLGYLRTQARHIFASPLSDDEKRRMFSEMARHPYVGRIKEEFALTQLPMLPRVAFSTLASDKYSLSLLLTSLRDLFPHK